MKDVYLHIAAMLLLILGACAPADKAGRGGDNALGVVSQQLDLSADRDRLSGVGRTDQLGEVEKRDVRDLVRIDGGEEILSKVGDPCCQPRQKASRRWPQDAPFLE